MGPNLKAPTCQPSHHEFKSVQVQANNITKFILHYAAGPLFFGPLSEIYGRVLILQSTNAFYLVFNMSCGFAKTKPQLIDFRFLSGLGGSAPLAIGGGVHTTWRWSFWAKTIADAAIQCLGLIFLRETYPAVLLGQRRERLIKFTGNKNMHTELDSSSQTLAKKLWIALTRPVRLLGTQIILSPSPESYDESIGIGGLNYISLGLGFFLGAQVIAPLQFCVPMMVPGAILGPVGLVIYGWTAEYKTNIGACLIAAGIMIATLLGLVFLSSRRVSVMASGMAWGNTLLALAAVVIGWPGPVMLWVYGERLWRRSPFAVG
ncbi:major facilitator superfamily domain-containing protein [Aspergillus undulatus]|uniref:major facilitator superfamily domain-containing protein n=1 Tax=Aspergillus undulatus TaxID=1810928 RepID=UPI003CCE15DD